MSVSPAQFINNFAGAFNAAMSSLHIGTVPQSLNDVGRISYRNKSIESMETPFVDIGVYKTTLREDYDYYVETNLDTTRWLFQDPGSSDNSIIADLDMLEADLDLMLYMELYKIDVPDEFRKFVEGSPAGIYTLKNATSALTRWRTKTENDTYYNFLSAMKKVAEAFISRAEELKEGSPISPSDSSMAAELYFISGIITSALVASRMRDWLPQTWAAIKFFSSAELFRNSQEHPVAGAMVAEVAAWFYGDDIGREMSLELAADLWFEGARAIFEPDPWGAVIANYRGLRAASMSGKNERLYDLFMQRAWMIGNPDINVIEYGNRNQEYLRAAHAKLEAFASGRITDEDEVLADVYEAVRLAYEGYRKKLGRDDVERYVKTLDPLVSGLRKRVEGNVLQRFVKRFRG